MPIAITNIFVLMLENRSFDHMLGFSGITGTDAATGAPTTVRGLTGTESNSYRGQSYTVAQPADETMPVDPGHEFLDVLEELCGTNSAYLPGGAYPTIDNSGFVSDYAFSHTKDEGNAPGNFGEIMKCFGPDQSAGAQCLGKELRGLRQLACVDSRPNLAQWNTSLLIVTWDEHGGFYDHMAPPAAVPPGDTVPLSKYNQYGFTFTQYGVRVPAGVVSPFIPANLVDPSPLRSQLDPRHHRGHI